MRTSLYEYSSDSVVNLRNHLHRDWVRIDGNIPDVESLTDPHCAAKPGEIYVIYIPEGNAGKPIEILNLANKTYKARWFNPRDGSSSAIDDSNPINADLNGKWNSPPVQDDSDWVLCLMTDMC